MTDDKKLSQDPATIKDAATLNDLQITSLNALVAYTAKNHQVTVPFIEDIFTAHFGIATVRQLPRDSFDVALRFLVELEINTTQN